MKHIFFPALILVVSLSGCSPVDIRMYKENQPIIDIQSFFNGNLQASGIVKNRKGEVTRHFNADIKASWDGDDGVLDEKFVFSDGELQTRIWKLTKIGNNTFVATANDVIGESILETAGNAIFLNYVLQVAYKGSTINLNVDDKMYLVNESTLINESIMTKFGFELAYITLYIKKTT